MSADKSKLPQRLYWSLNLPMKYLGLTIDEWLITSIGILPGVYFMNAGNILIGMTLIIIGISLCLIIKKFKKVTNHFLPRSFLIAKGYLLPPRYYPKLLGYKVGK